MKEQLLGFLAGTLGIWLVLTVPGWLLGGPEVILFTLVACGLCLVPMIGTMVWSHWTFRANPDLKVIAVLGGTGIRMLVVTVAGILLYLNVPELNAQAFLIWVVVFYLATLTLEVVLTVRKIQRVMAQGSVSTKEIQRS